MRAHAESVSIRMRKNMARVFETVPGTRSLVPWNGREKRVGVVWSIVLPPPSNSPTVIGGLSVEREWFRGIDVVVVETGVTTACCCYEKRTLVGRIIRTPYIIQPLGKLGDSIGFSIASHGVVEGSLLVQCKLTAHAISWRKNELTVLYISPQWQ